MAGLLAQPPTRRVILGLMTFGPDAATGGRVRDVGEFGRVLDAFQSRGYHEVDTARMYVGGQQEAFSREAGWKERGLTLATKILYPHEPGLNAHDRVLESIDTSLKELGTDCVDLLYLHAADRATPFADTLSAIDKLYKQGKFVRFGISNFAAFEVAEIVLTCQARGWVRPTVYQGMYNCITRSLEPELVPCLRRYGLDLVVYNPLAGGLFSGKIASADMVPASGRFSDEAASGRMYRGRYFRESTFRALRVVEAAAQKAGVGLVETALRWMVHHSALRVGGPGAKGNDGVIIGVSSREQLEENLTHLEKGPLPDELVAALDEAWAVSRADTVPYWHFPEIEYGYDTRAAVANFAKGAE